ncbi:MAG: hypothetical protein LBS83_02595, partial [Holosporales bacterium]|nr:hypothetical protein [Holosporales bacterium]
MTFTYKRGIPLSSFLLASWAIAPIGASEISVSNVELGYLYPGAEIQKSLPLSDIQSTCKYMVENYERLKNHLPLQNREIKGSDKWHI